MNNTTKIIEMLVDVAVPATSDDCFLSGSTATAACGTDSIKNSLQNSVPGWKVATVVFRLIGVGWFLKSGLKGMKEILAGTVPAAAKTFGFAAITLFLLFDIGNTMGYLLGLRTFFTSVFTKVQSIIDGNKT